jgi:hypothetical protein
MSFTDEVSANRGQYLAKFLGDLRSEFLKEMGCEPHGYFMGAKEYSSVIAYIQKVKPLHLKAQWGQLVLWGKPVELKLGPGAGLLIPQAFLPAFLHPYRP